jgi:hypothetical protein
MEQLKGHTFNSLPAVGLQKVFDLLEYDGPILSHFKDERGQNFLFYWVDNDERVNRWLVWRVTDLQLYRYLRNEISLKEVMEEPNKEYIYSVEIDSNLNHQNILAIELSDLPQAYQLEETLFFESEIPVVYDELFKAAESEDFYYQRLKETGLYFNIKPTSKKFGTIVSASEGADFLYNISKSLANFAQVSFSKNYYDKINDLGKFKKVLREVVKATEPQLSYAGISSFEVGVSVDVTQSFENGKYKEWQDQLIKEFETKVVNIDYSNKEQVQNIIDSYGEEDRAAIFGPYLEIIENEDIKVEATNYNHDFKRTYTTINRDLTRTIIPDKPKPDKKEVGSTFAYVVVEIPADKDFESIDKRKLVSGMLSFEKTDYVTFSPEQVETSRYNIKFRKPFEYHLRIDGKNRIAYCYDPMIETVDTDKNVAVDRLFNQLVGLYEQAVQEKQNLEYWSELIDLVTPVN